MYMVSRWAIAGYTAGGLLVYVSWPSIREYLRESLPFGVGKMLFRSQRLARPGKYTVGLINPAFDCFANSIFQSLAALPWLYTYLLQLYFVLPVSDQSLVPLSLALLDLLTALNEPIKSPKSLSPWPCLHVLERIHNCRISRRQNDAHELLHLILETLETEYERAKDRKSVPKFPFSGGQSQDVIECQSCGYVTTRSSSFLVMSLNVPQVNRIGVESLLCPEAEVIQDYACVQCRLRAAGITDIDPDKVSEDVESGLPRIYSTIKKQARLKSLPDILCIHLSRSIFGYNGAARNSCQVGIKEYLNFAMGKYKLQALVKHSGTHYQGHYECLRRKDQDIWKYVRPVMHETGEAQPTDTHSGSRELSEESIPSQGRDSLPFPQVQIPSVDVSTVSPKAGSISTLPISKNKPPKYPFWSVSDQKVNEISLSQVLSQKSSVYLLFYAKVG